jgi:hypothetical protein
MQLQNLEKVPVENKASGGALGPALWQCTGVGLHHTRETLGTGCGSSWRVITSERNEPQKNVTSRHVGKERTDGNTPFGHREQCRMFRPTVIVARQRELIHVSVDKLDCQTMQMGGATKNGRHQE